jgi:hypothetical protein
MKVVTVATKSDKYFPALRESCQRFGYELVVLGWGKKWKGFTWRFELLSDYLKTIPSDEPVCFVDAYDVIMLRPAEIMKKRFLQSNQNIIFAFDECQDKELEASNVDMFKTCDGKRLNAGTYIGYASSIIDMIAEVCSSFKCDARYGNDQQILTQYCDKKAHFHIDTRRDFFLILNEGYDKKIVPSEYGITFDENNELIFKSSHTPCVLHAPGQTNINEITRIMGLKSNVEFDWKIYFKYSFLPYLPGKIQYYAPMLMTIAVVIIICILFVLTWTKFHCR